MPIIFDPIYAVISGFFTGIGIIAGQYTWEMYIKPHIIQKAEQKILKTKTETKQNDNP
jgi:hypothetical protein